MGSMRPFPVLASLLLSTSATAAPMIGRSVNLLDTGFCKTHTCARAGGVALGDAMREEWFTVKPARTLSLAAYSPRQFLVTVTRGVPDGKVRVVAVRYPPSQDLPESGQFARALVEFVVGAPFPVKAADVLTCGGIIRNDADLMQVDTTLLPFGVGLTQTVLTVVGPPVGAQEVFTGSNTHKTFLSADCPSLSR